MTSYDDWNRSIGSKIPRDRDEAAKMFAKAKAPVQQSEDIPGLNGNDLTATKDILDAVQALSLALTDNRALIAALLTDNEKLREYIEGQEAINTKLNKVLAMQRAAIDMQNEQDGYSIANIQRQAAAALAHCRRGGSVLAEHQLTQLLGDITGDYRGWEE